MAEQTNAAPPRTNLSEKETDFIQQAFKDNEPFLKSIRALFFGLPTTQAERDLIKKVFTNEPLRAIMWKRFLPALDRESPIGQVQDVWLGVEEMVFGAMPSTIEQAVRYKDQAIAMTRTALGLLESPDGPTISLAFTVSIETDPLQIALLARNQFIRHVETQLSFLWVIANLEKKTPQQQQQAVRKNSSK